MKFDGKIIRNRQNAAAGGLRFAPLFAVLLAAAVLGAGCASAPENAGSADPASPPVWLANPDAVYPAARYISAVGSGPDRASAEKSALTALAGVFGQSVHGGITVHSHYADRVRGGVLEDSGSVSSVTETVATAVHLDTLIGAKIRETWTDRGGQYVYAIAVMDKIETALLYEAEIQENTARIAALEQIPEDARGTLAEYARLLQATETAEETEMLLKVLSVASPAQATSLRMSVPDAETYRQRCAAAAAGIPVAVSLENDRQGVIAQAFADVFTAAGFRITSGESRYSLRGVVSFSEVQLPSNPYTFSRGVVNAALEDSRTGDILLPYAVSAREGHGGITGAEIRTARTLAEKIRTEFAETFSDFVFSFSE